MCEKIYNNFYDFKEKWELWVHAKWYFHEIIDYGFMAIVKAEIIINITWIINVHGWGTIKTRVKM